MKIICIYMALMCVVACSNDEKVLDVLLPSNLIVNMEANESLNGEFLFSASADDVNFFSFDFGVDEGFVFDDDGVISFRYQEEGSYTIRVRAHTTSVDYIEIMESVDVTILPFNKEGYETPMSYSGYSLVWNDEFDGTSLSLDWNFEIGTGSNGWGNNELQYYREDNIKLKDGYLTIEARKEAFGDRQYTSSRITTEGKKEIKYGRIDIRAILPEGQGIWPALWMLGSNFQTDGWPSCGEIDIMEMIGGGGRENNVFGTLHWDSNGTYQCTCGIDHDYTLPSGNFNDEFHVFSIIWDTNEITWYVDDNEYVSVPITNDMEEFNNEFFFIFNIAVGGNLPGAPNSSTVFPQQMIIDYARVFQQVQ